MWGGVRHFSWKSKARRVKEHMFRPLIGTWLTGVAHGEWRVCCQEAGLQVSQCSPNVRVGVRYWGLAAGRREGLVLGMDCLSHLPC